MSFLKSCLLPFFMIAFIAMPNTASSALFNFGKKAPVQEVPKFPIHDEESFKANTRRYHDIPFNDPKFEFDIQLPRDWTAEPMVKEKSPNLSPKILSDIARFKGPIVGIAQTSIVVQAMHLDREISAENWLKNYVVINGYTLQENISSTSNKKASMGFVSVSEGKSAYTYATAQINGNIIILASFEIPLWLKDTLGFVQKRTIDSFRLIITTDDPVEIQKSFTMTDALKFTYPSSWVMHYPDFKDIHNMSVQIHNETPNKKIDGIIRFIAVHRGPKTSLDQEIKKLKTYFDEFMNIEFKKLVSSGKSSAYKRFIFSRSEIYEVRSKKKDVSDKELRLVVLGDKEWYIIVFLLTPAASDNLYAWATNTQTFDMIIKNLK